MILKVLLPRILHFRPGRKAILAIFGFHKPFKYKISDPFFGPSLIGNKPCKEKNHKF